MIKKKTQLKFLFNKINKKIHFSSFLYSTLWMRLASK